MVFHSFSPAPATAAVPSTRWMPAVPGLYAGTSSRWQFQVVGCAVGSPRIRRTIGASPPPSTTAPSVFHLDTDSAVGDTVGSLCPSDKHSLDALLDHATHGQSDPRGATLARLSGRRHASPARGDMTQAFDPQGDRGLGCFLGPPRRRGQPNGATGHRDRSLGGALGFTDLPRINRGTESPMVLTGELGILHSSLAISGLRVPLLERPTREPSGHDWDCPVLTDRVDGLVRLPLRMVLILVGGCLVLGWGEVAEGGVEPGAVVPG